MRRPGKRQRKRAENALNLKSLLIFQVSIQYIRIHSVTLDGTRIGAGRADCGSGSVVHGMPQHVFLDNVSASGQKSSSAESRVLHIHLYRDIVSYTAAFPARRTGELNMDFILAGHLAAYLLVVRRYRSQGGRHGPVARNLIASQTICGLLIVLLYSLMIPSMIAYFVPVAPTEQASGYSPWLRSGTE